MRLPPPDRQISFSTETGISCPVCTSSMCQITGGYSVCKTCGYMMSQDQPGAGAEIVSLDTVREKNFKFICKIIREKFSLAKTVLDVGCSTGLFLKVAGDEGLEATGLEPAALLAGEARARGYSVVDGFFPHAEGLSARMYDVIVFNDSFEHIQNLKETLHGIKKHLNKSGVSMISLPTSDGIIFRIAFLLNILGIKAPFNRLWQKGFASPHLHYFNRRNLKRFFENNGFDMKYYSPLYYYTIDGLWKRISCKSSFFVSVLAWLCLVLLYPLFTFCSDCFLACFSLPGGESNL